MTRLLAVHEFILKKVIYFQELIHCSTDNCKRTQLLRRCSISLDERMSVITYCHIVTWDKIEQPWEFENWTIGQVPVLRLPQESEGKCKTDPIYLYLS